MSKWDIRVRTTDVDVSAFSKYFLISFYYCSDTLKAFQMFDKDNDGTISVEELPAVLRYLGQNPSQKMVQEIMAEIDVDG